VPSFAGFRSRLLPGIELATNGLPVAVTVIANGCLTKDR
jgi:hypothetical protein